MLSFLRSSKEHKLSSKSKKILESYMAGAVEEIGFVKKNEAKTKAANYAADFYKAGKAEGLTKADIEAKEKQVAKDLKHYGLKERFGYVSDARYDDDYESLKRGFGSLFAVLGATMIAASVAKTPEVGALCVLGPAFAVDAAKLTVRIGGIPWNKNQERRLDEYTELKHAQLALKKLKREFKKTERSEEPAKLFTQVAVLKNQGR